jgi:hypothetical protein
MQDIQNILLVKHNSSTEVIKECDLVKDVYNKMLPRIECAAKQLLCKYANREISEKEYNRLLLATTEKICGLH